MNRKELYICHAWLIFHELHCFSVTFKSSFIVIQIINYNMPLISLVTSISNYKSQKMSELKVF